MAAPSAGNQQPWEFDVVTNKKTHYLQPFAIIPIGYPVSVAKQQDRNDRSRVHFD